jgi:SAM-dependent methyltransferase
VISSALLGLVRCPECGGTVGRDITGVTCASCRRTFDDTRGYLDMRPREAFAEQTKYLDDALHQDARHETVSPPLLGSKIRHDMLRKFLTPGPGDRLIDLGCGSGRTLVWTAGTGAQAVGIDISPFFSHDALERCDLILGDLRRSPLRDGAFTKAWSLDVLEHLSPDALRGMLGEAHRVLAEGGALFVYTHVRKNGWPAKGVRFVNGLAHLGERMGLLDLRQERLRKSDHLNPIADHEELARLTADCGFRVERITYYTPVIGALVENVLARMVERAMTRRARRGPASESADAAAVRAARATAKTSLGKRGWVFRAMLAATWVMKLDLVLFGRVQSGPFFALLRKTSRPS